MRTWAITILLLLPARLFAQSLSGVVIDRFTNHPIDFATVATEYISTYTSADGKFTLNNIHAGDTVQVTSIGYKPFKIKFDPHRDTITINLQQVSIMLRNVSVKAQRDHKLDSLRTRKEFASTFAYHNPTFMDMFITVDPYAFVIDNQITAPNNATSIVSVNLLSAIALLTKSKDQTTKLQKTLLQDEQTEYVDHLFSKQRITNITNMRGDSLLSFMDAYRPTVAQAKKMSDYDMMLYIRTSYAEFVKTYHTKIQSPLGQK